MTVPGKRRLTKTVERLDLRKANRNPHIPGLLGTPLNGAEVVEVAARPNFVYVRLRDNQSELIQAFNRSVAPVYNLPVLIRRDEFDPSRYEVVDIDRGRYDNWGGSSFVPKHAGQHMFNPDAPGGDIVWAYDRQLMPLLVHPSGTAGSCNVVIEPDVYYQDGKWKYGGGTGTGDLCALKPTDGTAKIVLVYLDTNSTPQFAVGSSFASTVTGIAQVLPFAPTLPTSSSVPLAWIRLVSGTSRILWDNIYDARPWIVGDGVLSTGTTAYSFASLAEAQAGVVSNKMIAPATLPIIMPNGGLVRTDETTTGDARGSGSADFQRDRTNTNEVAAGYRSALIGGNDNRVNSPNSFIGAGNTNTIFAGSNSMIFGSENYISGSFASVALGANNQIGRPADYGFTQGADNRVAVDDYGFATGQLAVAFLYGMEARATGGAGKGRKQRVMLTYTGYTISNAQTELFTNGASTRANLQDRTAWVFSILISAKSRTNVTQAAGYKFEGVIQRDVGVASVALVGSVVKTVLGESVAGWDTDVDADTTNGSLRIRVTGETSNEIDWQASLIASVAGDPN